MMILSFLARSAERGDATAVAMHPGDWEGRFRDAADAWYTLPLVEQSMKRLPGFVKELRAIIRDFRPDVIHAHNPTMMLGAALAAAGRRGIRLVGTLHGNAAGTYDREAVVCRLFKGPVTAVTPFIAEDLEKRGVRNIIQIQNGVSEPPEPRSREEFASRFGVGGRGRRLVVGVGRLADIKGWNLAIAAMPHLPEADLVIFGEGESRPDLERQIRDLGLSDRVKLPGVVDDVRTWTGAADAALVTSRGEGRSLAVLELLYAGIPLVAADVPGINDTVDERSAIMIDATDAEGTAAALREALAGGPGIRSRVEEGLALAAENSGEKMVDEYFALYEGKGAAGGSGCAAVPLPARPGVFHDWRWNGVVTLRVIDVAEGGRIPGFPGDPAAARRERDEVGRIVADRLPGATARFIGAAPAANHDEAFTRMHEMFAGDGVPGFGEIVILDFGAFCGMAYSHALGDSPTMTGALAPLTGRIAGVPVDDEPLCACARPVPPLLRAAITRLVRSPRRAMFRVRQVLADQRAAASPGPVPEADGRPRYRSALLQRVEGTRPPRAVEFGWDWRAAVAEELGPGGLNPNDAWLTVGLRRGNPVLERLGGNYIARIRIPSTGDRSADAAAAKARIRSSYPLARATVSVVPQQVRQLLGLARREQPCGDFPLRQKVPAGGLATAWTYNRVDSDQPWEASAVLVGPGCIAVNLYEGRDAVRVTVSAFVDDATWDSVIRASRRVFAEAGYHVAGE